MSMFDAIHPLRDERLNEYLDGALPPGEAAALRAHLAGCPDCAARLAGLARVFAALSDLPDEAPSRDLSAGVLAELRIDAPAERLHEGAGGARLECRHRRAVRDEDRGEA